ncbi:MAG TPA: UDP-forming cellulose synthase catalytic subunit [Acidiphilium sp.]
MTNLVTFVLAVVTGVLLLGAILLPMTGPLPEIEQGIVFGLLLVLYNLEGGCRRHRKRPTMRVAISVLTILLTCRYLNWRITDTLPFGFGIVNLVLGILLVIAELHGIGSAIMGQIINALPLERTAKRLGDRPGEYPTIDILIPTYNEDPVILETTVIAATQIDYPSDRYRVYILDDGGTDAKLAKPGAAGREAARRAESLRTIARKFGAIYLTRPENVHAKAGNINHALGRIDGELILILDCDHVPTRDFLTRTVGFFQADPKLFLLQTPHNFVTPDPIERNLSTFETMPAENELFYNVMQPGLDFWGAAFFCGSAAILRRSVLDLIGGISGKSITEDAETTVKAMCLGYRTAFYNRPLVSGLQPETFSGFILQRVRWAQGMMQIFVLDNVWLKSGLTFMQRLMFTNFAFYWLFPLARAILLLMPPLFLFFGFNVAATTPRQLLIYALPYYVAALVNSQYFYGRVRWPFISQVYETAQTVFLSVALIAVFRRPRAPTFKVTPKGEMLDRDFISNLAWPFYWLLALATTSLGIGMWRIIMQPQLRWALIFVVFWVILDMVALLGVIGALAERRQVRAIPRIVHQGPVWIRRHGMEWIEARLHDLGRGGARLALPKGVASPAVGEPVRLLFADRYAAVHTAVSATVRHAGYNGKTCVFGVQYVSDDVNDARLVVDRAFGASEILVGNARRRQRGVSIAYAFGFLIAIGGRGSFRHFRILGRNIVIRLRVARESRTILADAHQIQTADHRKSTARVARA